MSELATASLAWKFHRALAIQTANLMPPLQAQEGCVWSGHGQERCGVCG